MTYTPAVQSSISLATTSVTGADLNSTCFIVAGYFTKDRTTNFSSFQEVREDDTISSNSNAYTGALTFFSQSDIATPFYLGKRTPDSITFTPTTITNSDEYSFELEVYDEDNPYDDDLSESYTISIDSDTDATAEEIATALYTEIVTTQAIPNLSATDNTGSVTLTPDSGYSFLISDTTSNMTESFATTESAADLVEAIIDEIEEDFYFFAAEDHTEDFVLDMCDETEATGSGDYPKQYRFCSDDTNTLIALQDPAIDLLGMVQEGNYDRTAGEWNHEADDIFPELAILALNGAKDAGTVTWKFPQLKVVTAAKDPSSLVTLTTAKQGYIADRNASWYGYERGVPFMHGGTNASGEWTDRICLAA